MGQGQGKLLGLLWVAVAVLVGALCVTGLPLLARSIPFTFEQKVADTVGVAQFMDVCEGGPGQAALDKISRRLFPVLEDDARTPVTIQVVRGEEVNAFASLGGRIFVIEGLLRQARSAEEVAGVIAHEIEHVRHRHVIQGVFFHVVTVQAVDFALGKTGPVDPRLFRMLANLSFSREQEAQADYDGLRRLQKARIDVAGFRQFFERSPDRVQAPEMLSDHPAPESRARMVREFEGGPVEPLLTTAEWRAVQSLCAKPIGR